MNLPEHEIEFSAMRSRGPGGQNVNKTNSAIQLRWNLSHSTYFPLEIHQRLLKKLFSKLTIAGEIIIRSEAFRDQEANKKDALKKLNEMLTQALFVQKKRIKTKPSRGAREKRLRAKTKRSETKKMRSRKLD